MASNANIITENLEILLKYFDIFFSKDIFSNLSFSPPSPCQHCLAINFFPVSRHLSDCAFKQLIFSNPSPVWLFLHWFSLFGQQDIEIIESQTLLTYNFTLLNFLLVHFHFFLVHFYFTFSLWCSPFSLLLSYLSSSTLAINFFPVSPHLADYFPLIIISTWTPRQ